MVTKGSQITVTGVLEDVGEKLLPALEAADFAMSEGGTSTVPDGWANTGETSEVPVTGALLEPAEAANGGRDP